MKEKILVVNDDDGIRLLAQSILQAHGYETIEASNGSIGVEQAIQHKPNLILLDIVMPEMDGYTACQKLKESPVTKDIPILFFSSLTSVKDKVKGFELGGLDFINNVVDQGELLARVHAHLHIQSLTKSLMKSNEQLQQKQKSLDADLHAAAIIQQSFLPPKNLKISQLHLASTWLPAYLLGGDIFNLIQCNQNTVIFYMLDVSGHDVPSALVTVSVSQYLFQQNTSSRSPLSPKQIMLDLDKEYPLERFDRFFTIFYFVLDASTGVFSYSSAGHPPAVLLSKNKDLRLLYSGGTVIGLNGILPFDEKTESLIPGDKIILYTDGVTERKNLNNELYGTKRFYTLLENIKKEPPQVIIDAIQTALLDFGQGSIAEDDVSVMCIEFNGG